VNLTIDLLPVADLEPYEANARIHTAEAVERLVAIIEDMGWTQPILTDGGGIVAGHKRRLAALKIYERGGQIRLPGGELLPAGTVPVIDVTGWSEAQRRAYIIADNQTTLESGWDEGVLRLELAWLNDTGQIDMSLTGFDGEALARALAENPDDFGEDADGEQGEQGSGEAEQDERGSLLSRIDVTIDDPVHEVSLGDHFVLGERHHLFVTGVMRQWDQWIEHLKNEAIFCPYPGPFTPFGSVPEKHPLIMVQPDVYIAGHILDRYAEVNGPESVKRVSNDD